MFCRRALATAASSLPRTTSSLPSSLTRTTSSLHLTTRAMSSILSPADQETAAQAFNALLGPDVFDTPPPPEKDFMRLPPVGTYRRGPRHEPLMNVPPPEDPLLHFLTSMVMRFGERAKARRTVSRTLLHIHAFTRAPPLPILREAVLLASPAIRVRTYTQGTKAVQIPFALGERQRTHLGIKWLLEACKTRPGKRLEERLAREVVDILQKTASVRDIPADKRPKPTGVLKKKEEVHQLAMVNRGNVRVKPTGAKQA